MKKKIIAIFVLCAMLLCFTSSAFAAATSIIIDGQVAEIPAEMGSIKETDNRTFVPIRFVMENLGCTVAYDDSLKLATITSDDYAYLIQEGNDTLFVVPFRIDAGKEFVEAKVIQMDTAAFIDNDESRMYIPIRFLAEAIGYTVGWDEVTQIVSLTMN